MGRTVRAVMLGALFAVFPVADASAATPRFVRGLSVALPGPPGKVVAGEFSGDRHPDVVVAAGDLVLLRNAGDGGLVRSRLMAIPKAAASTPEGYQDVIAGDVNGDGAQDLVAFADLQVPERVVGHRPGGVAITLSIGSGARTLLGRRGGRPVPAGMVTLPVNASSPQLADVDDDGRLDLVFSATPDARYASNGGSALFMARGRGDGSFEDERALLDPLNRGNRLRGGAEIAAADFDRDGRIDIAVGAVDGIRIHPAIGSANPRLPLCWRVAPTPRWPSAISTAKRDRTLPSAASATMSSSCWPGTESSVFASRSGVAWACDRSRR